MPQTLWEGKFQVPTRARKATTKLTAYSLSVEDAQRTQISEEELCIFLWGFHWKPFAGTHRQCPALALYCEFKLELKLLTGCNCCLLGPKS